MTWLLIGIGNTLRRDDGLGPWLIDRIANWSRSNITTRAVHQLTPEIAYEMLDHDHVVFLDAKRDNESIELLTLEPSVETNRWGHLLSPCNLLAMTNAIGGCQRKAWILAVPGSDFDFGEGLSSDATHAGERALVIVSDLLNLHAH